MLFDNFDEIRIINLAYRTDRRAEMNRELKRVGLEGDPRVSFFDACTFPDQGNFTSKGARGVYFSQLSILKEAAARGHSVLILEDDTDFADGTERYELPAGWSIFYGGYYASDPTNLLASDIVGAHMMGFSRETVPQVAAYIEGLTQIDDLTEDGIHPPIDGAYVWFRRAHPEVPTHFAEPPLGNQRPSRTDIADLRIYDRLPLVRELASLARSARKWLKRR